ncbi:MAG: DUF2220 family protein [Sedimenticola sp.]|nr:DUF2220 family protein [Sedimenticola sp.]
MEFTLAMESNHLVERPPWLDDEPEIVGLLNLFITRLDEKSQEVRRRSLGIRLSPAKMKKLFKNNDDADRTWLLLKSLEGSVLTIVENGRRGLYEPVYQGAMIRLLSGEEDKAEKILRNWLNRPVNVSYPEQWKKAVLNAVERHHDIFNSWGLLAQRPQRVSGKSAVEVVGAFLSIADHLKEGLTLRQLSSRCFWGQSKYLDSKEEFVQQLYPDLLIQPRPVVVNVYLPQAISDVLFIENQDTYIHVLAGGLATSETTAIVYMAGFKGAAGRIRNAEGVSIHLHGQSHVASRDLFLKWWIKACQCNWALWFWGDLDFSGFMILKSLRGVFGDVQAWPDGYTRMLDLLNKAEGHSAKFGNKEAQMDPGTTGCTFSDQVLLPALRSMGIFIDQEAIAG